MTPTVQNLNAKLSPRPRRQARRAHHPRSTRPPRTTRQAPRPRPFGSAAPPSRYRGGGYRVNV